VEKKSMKYVAGTIIKGLKNLQVAIKGKESAVFSRGK
jgi:hypothetical protein